MGDRCNIAVQYEGSEKSRVYFYGHWCGSSFADDLQRALAKRWRWDDEAYLARIIFDEFVDSRGDELGYGIAPYIADNGRPILVVEPAKQEVRAETTQGRVLMSWSFEEYVALDNPSEALWRVEEGMKSEEYYL